MLVFGTSQSEKRLYPIPYSVHKRLKSTTYKYVPHGSDHILWNTQYFQFHFMLRRSLHVRPLTPVYNKICSRGKKYMRNFHASLQLAMENPNLDRYTSDLPRDALLAATGVFLAGPTCSVFFPRHHCSLPRCPYLSSNHILLLILRFQYHYRRSR